MNKSFVPYDGEIDGLWGGIARESREALRIMNEQFIPRPMNGLSFEMKIKPGVYFLRSCLSEDKSPQPMEMNLIQDEMIENKHKFLVRSEIEDFFKKRDFCEQRKLIHKRGIILHGEPGTGKTSIIREEVQAAAERGAIVFMARSPYVLTDSMATLRQMEPNRDLIVVMEDIDEIVRSWGEQELLEMMDGMNSVNHVLFIASTNHPECMSAKLRRPGRFDRKIKIPNPDFSQRKQYFAIKYENRLSEDRLDALAYHTEGFGFGQMREVFVSHSGYGRPLTESIKYVKKDMLVEQRSEQQSRLRGRKMQALSESCKSYGY